MWQRGSRPLVLTVSSSSPPPPPHTCGLGLSYIGVVSNPRAALESPNLPGGGWFTNGPFGWGYYGHDGMKRCNGTWVPGSTTATFGEGSKVRVCVLHCVHCVWFVVVVHVAAQHMRPASKDLAAFCEGGAFMGLLCDLCCLPPFCNTLYPCHTRGLNFVPMWW